MVVVVTVRIHNWICLQISLFLCLLQGLAAEDILFMDCPSACPYVCDHVLKVYEHNINGLWEFIQIYSWSAIEDKDKQISFWGQKVKGQGIKHS